MKGSGQIESPTTGGLFHTGMQSKNTYRWVFPQMYLIQQDLDVSFFFLQVNNPIRLTGGLFHTGTKFQLWSRSSDTEPWLGLGHTWPTKYMNIVSFGPWLITDYNQSKTLQRKLWLCLTSGFLSSSSVFLTRSVFFCLANKIISDSCSQMCLHKKKSKWPYNTKLIYNHWWNNIHMSNM